MKITVLVSNIYISGGVQKVVNTIFNQISKDLNYEITILSLSKTEESPFFDYNDNVKLRYLFPNRIDIKKSYFQIIFKLKKFLKKNETNILIVAGIGYSSFVHLASLRNKKMKVIGWEHQQFTFGKKFGLEWIGKRIAARHFDSLVVLTKEDYKQYSKGLKNINGLTQIYNPVNLELVKKPYTKNKRIISVGTLTYRKGFDMAVEVANKILNTYPEWEWHIFGEGEMRDSLEKSIIANGLQNRMILMGTNNDIINKYSDYSFLVMTSRNEGFPMTIIEAKSQSLPVVSFDCKTGPSELIQDNVNGYLIPCFDLSLMVSKISELIENEEKRTLFSNESARDLDKLNLISITEKWKNLFLNISGRGEA
ncbi:glycosyltransferase family 4 protein [Jeotgalibaca sp. A127]|uniref:glycosyltransferase family 4 protein n=1 Tax=Jeotgalibaca sp. A127 TaxID=3457324 RepID=UPI003FCF1C85